MDFYNSRRRHQELDKSIPDQVYYDLPLHYQKWLKDGRNILKETKKLS